MKSLLKTVLKSVAMLVIVFTGPVLVRAAGFPLGQLLVSYSSTAYLVDPQTGSSNQIATGLSGLGDIVFNPVSGSAFAVQGSNIVQITASGAGYVVTPFVTGIRDIRCLAVDGAGNVYFNQVDSVQHRLWRATLAGTVTVVTAAAFFVPEHMIFSGDYSKLYVFSEPDNRIQVVSLPAGTVLALTNSLSFPSGGDTDIPGNIYVIESSFAYRISRIDLSGMQTTYAQQPWMNSFYSGDDLEYDEFTGAIYATTTAGLYALYPDLTNRKLFTGNGFFGGISLITGAQLITQQPSNQVATLGATAVFSVEATGGGPYAFQWRLNGTNIPSATSASLIIANIGLAQIGRYSVFVSGAGGQTLSVPATLSLLDLNIYPVVTIAGPVVARYRVEFRTDMEPTNTWHLLTNATATANPYYVVDTTTPRPAKRFYRATALP